MTSRESASQERPNREEWERVLRASLKGADPDHLAKTRDDGIVLDVLYDAWCRADALPRSLPHAAATPTWCAHISDASVEVARAHLEEERDAGTHTHVVRLDRAARVGEDADATGASVGVDGVSVSSAYELARLLSPLDLESHAVRVDVGMNLLPWEALSAAVAERARVPRPRLTIGASLGDALLLDARLPGHLDAHLAHLAAGVVRTHADDGLRLEIVVRTEPTSRGGGTQVDELGFALAEAVDVLRAAQERGVDPALTAKLLRFEIATGRDFFGEIAKLRALRILWQRTLRACGLHDEITRITSSTAGRMMTPAEPWTNMIRGTTAALAGILGGADTLMVTPFDRSVGESSQLGRRIARNTAHVLAHEANAGHVLDPAQGSYFLETLTDQLVARAWRHAQELERDGGWIRAAQDGRIQHRLAEARADRLARQASREEPVIGVSVFASTDARASHETAPHLARLKATRASLLAGYRATTPFAITDRISALLDTGDVAAIRRGVTDAARSGGTVGAIVDALHHAAPPYDGVAVTCMTDGETFELHGDLDAQRPRLDDPTHPPGEHER